MPKISPDIAKAKAKRLVKRLHKNNLSIAETAREFGVTPQAIQNQIAKNPYVKNYITQFYDKLDKAGATDDKAARVISEGMDAKKEVYDKDGNLVAEREDHSIRLKSVEMLARIKRYIGDTDSQNVNVGEMKVMIVNGSGGNQETFLRSPQRESVGDSQASGEVPSSGLR